MKKMYKLLPMTLAVVLAAFVFTGCSNTKSPEEQSELSGTPASEVTGTQAPTVTTEPAQGTPTEVPIAPTSAASFNYSQSIAATGYWENVHALDYVTLCDYSTINVPKEKHEISDISVQEEIDSLLSSYATSKQITDRALADGDTINIDFDGTIDGVAFEGGSTGGQGATVTIGVTNFIDDFLQQLIGHKPGEEFDIEVTFPEDYRKEEFNGKDAVFSIKINYIEEYDIPELTDTFVETNLMASYGFKTVEELRTGIADDMKLSAITSFVETYIVENSTISSVPESMIAYQEDMMLDYFTNRAASGGITLEEFLVTYMQFASVDELLEFYKSQNTAQAESHLVIQAVAEANNFTVSDQDLNDYFSKYLGSGSYVSYESYYGKSYLKQSVVIQKVIDLLVERASLA